MGQRAFDRKFGSALVEGLPTGPGVYLFRDADESVLYVGKAKNVRRRLQSYRNASRRKVHRKMRTLVREASSVEVRVHASEREALLQENALIRELRPPYNVDGAFAFLYPAVGLARRDVHTLLCFSTRPEAFAALDLRWFGTFRSRPRAKEAFDALVELLALVGHLSKRTQLPRHASVRGSRLVGLRQLPQELTDELTPFFAGEDRALLAALSTALLAKPRARRDAAHVEARLRLLDRFYEADTRKLRLAMERLGRTDTFVPQDDRDALFILARFESDPPGAVEPGAVDQ
ncbi:MAG: nucleotide excision repair endonuclease [Acidobacteria bacterium]|nr:nucleotide excision repair endonuclease [Acidobacteriota bacterium]